MYKELVKHTFVYTSYLNDQQKSTFVITSQVIRFAVREFVVLRTRTTLPTKATLRLITTSPLLYILWQYID